MVNSCIKNYNEKFSKSSSVNKYPNFENGGIFQQGKTVNNECNSNIISTETSNDNNKNFINPLIPPVVKLTKQSSTYAMARLRDRKIFDSIRIYLAYLHDKPNETCVNGCTRSLCKITIATEGLPTEPIQLKKIYYDYQKNFGMNDEEIKSDLTTYGKYLQKSRDNNKKFFFKKIDA
jgi:hypothetical protein